MKSFILYQIIIFDLEFRFLREQLQFNDFNTTFIVIEFLNDLTINKRNKFIE